MKFLAGKRTYLAAIAMAIGAAVAFHLGAIDGATLYARFTEAMAIAGLRAGVEQKKE